MLTLPFALRRSALPLAAALLCTLGLAVLPAAASADSHEVTMMEDDGLLLSNPGPTLEQMRDLGVQVVRLDVRWDVVAPKGSSYSTPSHFTASNPSDYGSGWNAIDNVVRDATADGLKVDLTLTGNAPLWATAKGDKGHGNWEPNPADFGSFTRAAGTRYDGKFTPKGNSTPLPKVSFWTIWNEPNYGPDVAPQGLPGHRGLLRSGLEYRELVNHAVSALKASGHTDKNGTILIGELAPRSNGGSVPGVYNMVAPLIFTRALYCLGSNDRPLTGTTAHLEGCPTTSAGSRRFASENPGLFDFTGFSDHPYMSSFAPNDEVNSQHLKDFTAVKRNYSSLATIGNLETGIDRALAAYGVHRTVPIWDTEFGYITKPPASGTHVSLATAADYDNWAEYLSWKDSRIASFDNYLLQDPSAKAGSYDSGLIFSNGKDKPGFGAFRLPLYLPTTTAKNASTSLEVWGEARPVGLLSATPPTVQILFKAKGQSAFAPLGSPIAPSTANGSFETRVTFHSSGTVELQWTYPTLEAFIDGGKTVTSRQVAVTVK